MSHLAEFGFARCTSVTTTDTQQSMISEKLWISYLSLIKYVLMLYIHLRHYYFYIINMNFLYIIIYINH